MKYTLMSPSKLALQSVNQSPVGYESKIDGACILCGFAFHPGDLIVDANIPDSFTNHYDLGAPNSQHLCGYCAVTNNKPWTQAWMSSVITKDGLFKFASNNDIAHWLLNPPEPPFVMMRGDQQIQHLIWRTPVNYSREVYQVRMGEKLLTIRRAHLVEANDALHRISDRMIAAANTEKASAKQKKNKGKSFVLPFIRPVRDLDDVNAGQLRHDVLSLAKESGDPQFAADIDVINRSTPGELWALSILPYSEPVTTLNKHEVKL